MRFLLFFGTLLVFCAGARAVVVTDDIHIDTEYLRLELGATQGGTLQSLALISKGNNFAGEDGLLQEGFGTGSFYLPNRRLNETLEVLDEFPDRPVLRFSYDCQGPNIQGLRVTRIMEPLPNESSIRVLWRVENRGIESQWVAPWIRNEIRPGGSVDTQDRWQLPTIQGVVPAATTKWYPATRNWYAVTDPVKQETLYCVFHADQVHSNLVIWDEEGPDRRAIQTAFVPFTLEPGGTWETTYRVNLVEGLQHVDFATEELAAQLDHTPGKLVLLLSPAKQMAQLEILSRVMAPNNRIWRLPAKQFNLAPRQLARCTYAWDAPGDDRYEFLAQVQRGGEPLALGTRTGSPHGGIDTQFVTGRAARGVMEAWTDAVHALDKGPRALERTLLASGELLAWVEPSMEKVFRSDWVRPNSPVDAVVRLAAARNEHESFQIVLRPNGNRQFANVRVRFGDLLHRSGQGRITAANIRSYQVGYVPVPIPSHFEGPTGLWPDPLPPLEAFTIDQETSHPLWFTVQVPEDAAAGGYEGTIEITSEGRAPIAAKLHLEVFDFALPRTPALKTDFGFWMEAALAGAKLHGGNPSTERLTEAYLQNAFEHRVTLRDLVRFPEPTSNYAATLAAYEPQLRRYLALGASTVAVPGSLMADPAALKAANDFVKRTDLRGRAFVPLANEPPEPAWPHLIDAVKQWKSSAPDIPAMVSTYGVRPFIDPSIDLWALHAQVFDTGSNVEVLNHITSGREVWWYVNNTPPRPYANFFVDFAGIEHRILFWQSFALGVRGMHYWNVNYSAAGEDPWRSVLDETPVNGDGLLVYPGPEGPVNSIRWEIIRDGIEDYDYLTLLMERRNALMERRGNEAALQQAANAYDLGSLVPSLVSFSRDPEALLGKRTEIARAIEAMDAALAQATPAPRVETPASPVAPVTPDPEPRRPPTTNFGPAR